MKLSSHALVLSALGLGVCAGCSDPVPPAPHGAWVVEFQSLGNCGPNSHVTKMGDLTAVELTALEQDTVNGARIDCGVRQDGNQFSINAYAAKGANALQISVSGLTKAATSADGEWVAGAIRYQGAQSVNDYSSPADEPCHFFFETDPQRNNTAAGIVWLSFECPVVENVSINEQCILKTSRAAFELCDE